MSVPNTLISQRDHRRVSLPYVDTAELIEQGDQSYLREAVSTVISIYFIKNRRNRCLFFFKLLAAVFEMVFK
jgi:hypothetical protein